MTQTILAFGDSNTHGTPPMTSTDHHPRLTRRWPVVMAEKLHCTLIEDALPGRTACAAVANAPDVHLDGQLGLRIALNAHGPIDHLLIMLGTNDLKTEYGRTPDQIIGGLAWLLAFAHDPLTQARHDGFSVTLICPPPTAETGTFVPRLYGSVEKCRSLRPLMQDLAKQWGAGFLDAGAFITVDPLDGTHFDTNAHAVLGQAVADCLMPSSA